MKYNRYKRGARVYGKVKWMASSERVNLFIKVYIILNNSIFIFQINFELPLKKQQCVIGRIIISTIFAQNLN